MDPSRIKLFELDEMDEITHACADVGALVKALYRDMEGIDSTNLAASITNRNAGTLTQDDSSITLKNNLQFTKHLTESELLQHGNTHCDSQRGHSDNFSRQDVDNSPSQDIHQHSKVQQQKVQQFNNQQPPNTDLSNNSLNWKIQKNSLKLNMLVPQLHPLLDNDRSMLLRALHIKLLNNEISKENYLKVCKKVVGDRMFRREAPVQAQMQLQAQAAWESNQKKYLSHAPVVPGCKIDVEGGHVAQSYATVGSAVNNLGSLSKVYTKALSNAQQHPPTVQTLFSMCGSSFQDHAYIRPSISTTSTSLKLQNQSSQMRKPTVNPSIASSKAVSTQPMNIATIQNYELYKAVKNHKNMHYGSTSQMLNQHHKQVAQQTLSSSVAIKEPACGSQTTDYVGKNSIGHDLEFLKKHQFSVPQSTVASVYGDKGHETLKDELHEKKFSNACCPINSSAIGKTTSPAAVVTNSIMQNPVQSQSQSLSPCGTSTKFPPKEPPIGKKKTLEPSGNYPPQASKKQKTSGAFLDQSIEQLNDVTAVSGVNLRAEEEQLLVARTEGTQASEAIQRVVQEEEETSLLQKGPLQKKLTQIISRCGLGGISKDVEYCLSMCVEGRLRSFIGNLIRLSKQRVDIENKRRKLVVTSDIQHQILTMNQKAKKEWEKKQAEESEKFWKLDNALADAESDVEKDKDNRASKKHKFHREEDDKMRTTAANAAARAAIGVDDMLSKWQLMAEQARQKRESKLGNHSLNFRENLGNLEEDGGMRRHGRSIGLLSNPKIDRTICIKDVIAALEKEPMMSRSTLLYRLYERRSGGYGAG